jgi:hypothetical protein
MSRTFVVVYLERNRVVLSLGAERVTLSPEDATCVAELLLDAVKQCEEAQALRCSASRSPP